MLSQSEIELARLKIEMERIRLGHERYEKIRLLKPIEFLEIYQVNIRESLNFDEIIDALDRRSMSVPAALKIVRDRRGIVKLPNENCF